MTVTIICCGAIGDSGKGRFVDYLSKDYDLVARWAAGNNAGHTVYLNEQKYVTHLVPSGIFRDKECLIGTGCVLNPEEYVEEIQKLKLNGFDTSKIFISDRAHITMPYHIDYDKKMCGYLGTTNKGIGPTYTTKAARVGIRVKDVFYLTNKELDERIRASYMLLFGHRVSYAQRKTWAKKLRFYMYQLQSQIVDATSFINDCLRQGKKILCEGAQGTQLDIDHGDYPFISSSNAIAGGVCTGLGISPLRVTEIVGITKAYLTKVGTGPFPTELFGETAEDLRKRGMEFGSTTGRPRRCGWLDLVALRKANEVNGFTSLAIAKLDVLKGLEKICYCNEYDDLGKPILTSVNGWEEDITEIKEYKKLPINVQKYIETIEDKMRVHISLISTGKEREQIIQVGNL